MNLPLIPVSIAAVLRTRPARLGFLILMIVAAVAAIAAQQQELSEGLSRVTTAELSAALCLSLGYLFCAGKSWHAVLSGLGSEMTTHATLRIFFVSQIGKYLPGGIFSFAAAAEMSHDTGMARRYTVSTLIITLVLSVATGAALALALLPLAAPQALVSRWWTVLIALTVIAALHPALLQRILSKAHVQTDRRLSGPSISMASAWAIAGWSMIGLQVSVLAAAIGAPMTLHTAAVAVGGFALAWVAGFIVLIAPAGFGPREATLTLVLATILSPAEALMVALLSRVIVTAAELVAAGAGLALPRR